MHFQHCDSKLSKDLDFAIKFLSKQSVLYINLQTTLIFIPQRTPDKTLQNLKTIIKIITKLLLLFIINKNKNKIIKTEAKQSH